MSPSRDDVSRDPAGLVAEAARRAPPAGPAGTRRPLLDPVGDAVAVLAALLQSTGGLR
ncbi:hypothetical protein V2I01_36060 [Micromonospora sp. BRA006-A]|nr:hypothetical protein [Micromonospora sp. BRA006-A]